MLAFDAVRLANPADGWRANGACWLRNGIEDTAIGGLALTQLQCMVPEIMLAHKQVAVIAIAAGIANTGLPLLLTAYWKFPIPFTYTVGSVPPIAMLHTLVVVTRRTRDT